MNEELEAALPYLLSMACQSIQSGDAWKWDLEKKLTTCDNRDRAFICEELKNTITKLAILRALLKKYGEEELESYSTQGWTPLSDEALSDVFEGVCRS